MDQYTYTQNTVHKRKKYKLNLMKVKNFCYGKYSIRKRKRLKREKNIWKIKDILTTYEEHTKILLKKYATHIKTGKELEHKLHQRGIMHSK